MITTTADKGHRAISLSMWCESLEDILRLRQWLIDARDSADTAQSKLFFTTFINQLESCLPVKDHLDEMMPGQNPANPVPVLSDILAAAMRVTPKPRAVGVLHEKDIGWVVQARKLDSEELIHTSGIFTEKLQATRHCNQLSELLKESSDVFYSVVPSD